MRLIEQILLSVSSNPEKKKIEPVRKTDGVLAIELDEELLWAESLRINADGHFAPMNLFFHPLPSGRFALGRALPGKTPHRGTNGDVSFLIHSLIIDAERLYLFGNNPVALHLAAIARPEISTALFRSQSPEPTTLDADGSFFDPRALQAASIQPGIEPVAALCASVVADCCTLFSETQTPLHLISAILNLLPIDCRTEVSFASELYFSPERCLRLAGFSKLPREGGAAERYPGRFLDLAKPDTWIVPAGGWGRFVRSALENDALDFFERRLLAEHLTVRRKTVRGESWFPPSADELNRLGDTLHAELARYLSLRSKNVKKNHDPDLADPSIFSVRKRDSAPTPPLSIGEKLRRWLLEDHPDESVLFTRQEAAPPTSNIKPSTPPLLESEIHPLDGSNRLEHEEPLLIYEGNHRFFSPFQRLLALRPGWEKELLELDSLIAHTLAGDTAAGSNLARCWQRLVAHGDQEFLFAAQEEYIHYVQAILLESANGGANYSPKKSLPALDLLDLFLNGTFA